MFPRLPARATFFIVADTNFVSGTNVSDFVQKHFVSATNVSQFAQPKKHHGQQWVRNNVSSFTRAYRHRTWSFHVLVLQRTTKKCTKIYNARAQLLFCSLNLFFSNVLVAVVVVVCLSSLLIDSVQRRK